MKKFIKENYGYVLVILLIIIIRTFFVTHILVDGPSMEPTLSNNNIMLLNKTAYWNHSPKRFDIVVVDNDGLAVIKRVIALPGEIVRMQDDVLYINDREVKQPFKHKLTDDFEIGKTIPKNYYFVLGDNRPVSQDSRYFGLVNIKNILGNTHLGIIPFRKF